VLAPAVPIDEEKRLATLRGLNVLDTPPEERFDRLTRLAQRIFDVPIAVITLVDSNRQWFKSCQGLDATETPRSISFCGHAILGDEVFVIPDAALDPRFADNPLVAGAPHIRFYAGQPLKANNGSRLGTLCILDIKPRQPSQDDLDVLRDLAALVESELNLLDAIWKQANFDTLTGLPNRNMFHDRLEQEAIKFHRTNIPLSLLLIDLDQFKEVNDTLGHAVGDALLQEAAHRIRACVRKSDTVARLGGDEFTVILPQLADTSHVEDIAQKIINKMAEPYHLGSEIVYVSASIGITLYPNDAADIDILIQNADQAMYVAKNQGRNRFSYFTPALQQAAQTRLRLIHDLRGALAANQFRVYFQPIVELSSGHIHKAEALLRWQHPERGMVSPMEFIPLAEETGLIVEIGDWVFQESARWMKRWNNQFANEIQTGANQSPMQIPGCCQISVNVSPVQFKIGNSVFAEEWLQQLQKLGFSGKNIVIEITEGLLLNAESDILKKLLKLRDAGIQVAIDDFGTGYSSLSYLKKFDIDYLKIDQSFVRNLETDPNDMALSEAIIVMAHTLGLKVIAEGVETEGQRKLLAAAGCDYAQGYLFSKPVPPEEFEALLKSRLSVS
jgi:diguanylate cyclase (GGDEF)-like protein